jgi:hypothetical protein
MVACSPQAASGSPLHHHPLTIPTAIAMTRASFDQSPKTEMGGAPTTYADAKGPGYELDAVYETTVAEKHRGTLTDQHDMQILGRTQELRV